MAEEPRCYFGCSGRLKRTLLDLPDHPSPRLCEDHSEAWGTYRAALIAQNQTIEWPEDFWPFERRMREQMQEQMEVPQAPAEETRKPGTEIMASEAVAGAWYEVPSGEIERCVGSRARGRGVQVGFAGLMDSGADPEDIRWLQGRTSVIVGDEISASKLVRAIREDAKGPCPDLRFEICPRNGLLCSVCESPQRETPSGASCANGHGGAPGRHARDVADALGADGHTQEAQVVLESVPPSARLDLTPEEEHALQPRLKAIEDAREVLEAGATPDMELSAGGPGLTFREIAQAFPQFSDLTGLAAREAVQTGQIEQGRPLPKAGPSSIFHKSLHIDWRTPKALFDSQVRRWGPFWLDAAATAENKLCPYHLGPGAEVEDALSVDWLPTPEIVEAFGENDWLNHPYSKGEKVCAPDCAKPKCVERGYHLERSIASSGEWMIYARDQVLLRGVKRVVCLTKAAVETGWWRDAVRKQPPEAGKFLGGTCDPNGGPAAEFMDPKYPAATWFEFRWENLIVDVVEIEGRVDFDRGGDDGSAGFPSAIVTFYRPD